MEENSWRKVWNCKRIVTKFQEFLKGIKENSPKCYKTLVRITKRFCILVGGNCIFHEQTCNINITFKIKQLKTIRIN